MSVLANHAAVGARRSLRPRVGLVALVCLILTGMPALADEDDAPAAALKPAVGKPSGHVVEIDPADQRKGGIATSLPKAAPLRDVVRAFGTVLGTEKLTTLYNSSLTQAAQLRAAQAKADASRTAYERAQNMLKAFATAKAQAEAAEATYRLDSIEVESVRAQMSALRNTAVQDWGPTLGPAILAHTPLVEDLLARRRVLVEVALPPGATLVPASRFKLRLPGGEEVEASLISQASQADPKTQGQAYLVSAPAVPGLMPGISVEAEVSRQEAAAGVGIPPSAVVWQGGKPWVYLRTAPNTFERRPLGGDAAPTEEGGYVVPAASVPRDEGLVIAGAQILLSQESRAQIPSDEDDN